MDTVALVARSAMRQGQRNSAAAARAWGLRRIRLTRRSDIAYSNAGLGPLAVAVGKDAVTLSAAAERR